MATRRRYDGGSTEFGLWLRGQMPGQQTCVDGIDSAVGFVATNVDYVWQNYKTGEWMIIEEKRYGRQPRHYQDEIYKLLDKCAQCDPLYRGFYLLVFERTNPEDGRIILNHKVITIEQLIRFLQFKEI